MTSLEQRLQADMKEAMKAGNRVLLGTIRLVRSRLQYAKMEVGDRWSEEAAFEAVASAAKMHRDSIEQYEKAGRDDLATREREELAIVERYLPAQLTDEEIDALIDDVIAQTGASSPKDVGRVMGALMPKVKGRADGKAVSTRVRQRLGSG